MFIRLLKNIFTNLAAKPQQNTQIAESQSHNLENFKFSSQLELNKDHNSQLVDSRLQQAVDSAFYDYLLGASEPETKMTGLEQAIYNQVDALLAQPDTIINELPAMPHSIATMISMMNNDDFNTHTLLGLIKQEPAVSAAILALANSPMFRRSEKPVAGLKSAFVQLGANGIKECVLMSFIKRFNPADAGYFQSFGENLWEHAQQSALFSKQLATEELNPQAGNLAFLAGLINQLGKMIIFQLVIDAYKVVNEGVEPNSFYIKAIMRQRSSELILAIAKHWNLPKALVDALEDPKRVYMSYDSIAAFVSQGSTISQLECICQAELLSSDICVQYANQKLISPEASTLLYDILGEIEKNKQSDE